MRRSIRFAGRRGARLCAPLLLTLLVLAASPASAQAPAQPRTGGATYRVFENGTPIGVVTSSVVAEAEPDVEGWVIRGSSFIGGKYGLTVRRFEAHYDLLWRARFATMELSTPAESLVAHTAINGGRARTEVVQPGREAIWGANTVSADTIVMADMVFTAYEALAARLATAVPGTQLPIYVLPLGEIRARLESVTLERLSTAAGPLAVRRWTLTFLTATRESAAEVWESGGRLMRVEMPAEHISVIRSDVTSPPGP